MSLQDLVYDVRKHLEECVTSDVQGRPDEVKSSLRHIAGLITGFLAEPETPQEEPVNEAEVPTPPGRCVPDETHEASADSKEKQEELGDNQKPETDSTDG